MKFTSACSLKLSRLEAQAEKTSSLPSPLCQFRTSTGMDLRSVSEGVGAAGTENLLERESVLV